MGRAQGLAVALLGVGAAQHAHLGAQGRGELDGHVAQAAETDDGDLLAGAGAPALERRPDGDAGAEQRRGDVELDAVGDADREALGDDDLLGVAALGRLAVVALAVVGHDGALGAELLLAVLAELALAARVDHAADADAVADLVLRDAVTDGRDDTGDLVAGDHGEDGAAPLLADLVDVAVADAGELDVDEDVVVTQVAVLDGPGLEGGSGARCDQGGGGNQGCLLRGGWRRSWSSAASPGSFPVRGSGSNVCDSGHSLASRDVATSR